MVNISKNLIYFQSNQDIFSGHFMMVVIVPR